LVREEALKALTERQTRIVRVDLDDEVLGVGMPCGGNMEVYLEPRFPPRSVLIAGQNRLARHLSALAGLLGYAVTVHAPQADPEHFPTAQQVTRADWSRLEPERGGTVLIAGDHEEHGPILRRVLEAQPGYVGMVASRKVAEGLRAALRRQGVADADLAALRSPAGLDLGARTLEEISFSVLSELLAWERRRSGRPLRAVRETYTESGPPGTPSRAGATPPPPLIVVGHGRIAEELARLGALAGRKVTVNAVSADPSDFPSSACLVTGELDYAAMDIAPGSQVVIATLHKGDHLSMRRALEGQAAYIGLVASPKRSKLVLDYVQERGVSRDRLHPVHAPAGLDLGAINPTEIAFSILAEMVAMHRGGTCRPLTELDDKPASGGEASCRELFG
jgi:xanthine dehydrogenase accessory factor